MNDREDIMSRLLKLFPKNLVRVSFKSGIKNKDTFYEDIINNSTNDEIIKFAYNNLTFTKQHVYVFSHNFKNIKDLPKNILNKDEIRKEENGVIEYFNLFDVKYFIYLLNPYDSIELLFKWPIYIKITNNLIFIHCTILERNIQSYFEGRSILTTKKSIEDKEIIELILGILRFYGDIETCDLNKGTKEIWKKDIVDALEIQYQKSKSVTRETMDEECTFKQQYPEQFNQAILTPLIKVAFIFLTEKEKYSDHFGIEPCSGKIIFPTFSKKKEELTNVIQTIIQFN